MSYQDYQVQAAADALDQAALHLRASRQKKTSIQIETEMLSTIRKVIREELKVQTNDVPSDSQLRAIGAAALRAWHVIGTDRLEVAFHPDTMDLMRKAARAAR